MMKKAVDRPKGCSPYNYTAAFVAWCRGTPTEEICAMFGIPKGTLAKVMKKERWGELQPHATLPVAPKGEQQNQHMLRCLENREKNLKIAEKLREDVSNVLTGLLSGRKQKRYWQYQGRVIEHEVEWNMQDRVALANYMTMVANLTYRALGDKEASTAGTSDRPEGSPPPTSITLVLPGAVATPRDVRPVKGDKPGVVVDLDKAFGGKPRDAQDGDTDGAPPGGRHWEPEDALKEATETGVVEPTE
jgi:hypothetical protein